MSLLTTGGIRSHVNTEVPLRHYRAILEVAESNHIHGRQRNEEERYLYLKYPYDHSAVLSTSPHLNPGSYGRLTLEHEGVPCNNNYAHSSPLLPFCMPLPIAISIRRRRMTTCITLMLISCWHHRIRILAARTNRIASLMLIWTVSRRNMPQRKLITESQEAIQVK